MASLVSALRYRDFRTFWLGNVISVAGLQGQWVAEGWIVYELTGSKVLLGGLGLVRAIPATLMALLGGAMADKVDQRRLLMTTQFVEAASLIVLATLAVSGTIEVWHIMLVAFISSGVGAFENPARQALFPHLIERSALMNAVALNSTIHPGTRILGPAVAGVLLASMQHSTGSATIAAGAVYYVAAAGLVVFAACVNRVRIPPVARTANASLLQDISSGLKMVWKDRTYASLIGVTYYNTFFAISVSTLFPVFAKDVLEVGPSGLGLLYTAMGVGNLAGAISAAGLGNLKERERLIMTGIVVQGVFLIAFALSDVFALSLATIGIMGLGSSLQQVSIQSTLQLLVPDGFRGRVMGLWGLTHTSVAPLGQMEMGAVAALASAPFAAGIGGALVILLVLLALAPNRRIRRLDVSEETALLAQAVSPTSS